MQIIKGKLSALTFNTSCSCSSSSRDPRGIYIQLNRFLCYFWVKLFLQQSIHIVSSLWDVIAVNRRCWAPGAQWRCCSRCPLPAAGARLTMDLPQFSAPSSKLLVWAAQLQPQSKNHLPAVLDAKSGGWYFLFYSTAQISPDIECSYLHSYLPNLSLPKVILLFFEWWHLEIK